MTIARLHAIRRMLLTLLCWVEEDLRARGWRGESQGVAQGAILTPDEA